MSPDQWERFDLLIQRIEASGSLSKAELTALVERRVKDEDFRLCRMVKAYFAIAVDPIRSLEGQTVGHYRLGALIGEGSTGAVYTGHEQSLPHRLVAVKLIHPRYSHARLKERFLETIKLHKNLGPHPHIAPLLSAGIHPDSQSGEEMPYCVMPYIEGHSPLTAYTEEHRLSDSNKLRFFSDLCSGIRHLHDNGITHGDIRASNIIVDRNGHLFIIDVGMPRTDVRLQTRYPGHGQQADIRALGRIMAELFRLEVTVARKETTIKRTIVKADRNASALRSSRRGGTRDSGSDHQLDTVIEAARGLNRYIAYSTVRALHEDVETLLGRTALPPCQRMWLKGLTVLLAAGVLLEVAGGLSGSLTAIAGGWLLIHLLVALSFLTLFLTLTFAYLSFLKPAFNSVLRVSYGAGLSASLIGGLIYAFGPPAVTEPAVAIHSIWQIKLLRFMAVGSLLPLFYGSIFSISAAKRKNSALKVGKLQVVVALSLIFTVGALVFTSVHLTKNPYLSIFLGNQTQGDVRVEVFILVAYLNLIPLIAYDNWMSLGLRALKREDPMVEAFLGRMFSALLISSISGALLSGQFWGQGLTPDRSNLAFAMFTITLISFWCIATHYAFTGRHRLVCMIDRLIAPPVVRLLSSIKALISVNNQFM